MGKRKKNRKEKTHYVKINKWTIVDLSETFVNEQKTSSSLIHYSTTLTRLFPIQTHIPTNIKIRSDHFSLSISTESKNAEIVYVRTYDLRTEHNLVNASLGSFSEVWDLD